MPTKKDKQYKFAGKVRTAVEQYGSAVRPVIVPGRRWDSWSNPNVYTLRLEVDGKDVLKANQRVTLEVLNQGLQTITSTIEANTAKTRKPRKGEYTDPQPLRVVA